MKIHCHTNLDLYPCEKWPCELPCRPMIGDVITSSTGLELEVVKIRFGYPKKAEYPSRGCWHEVVEYKKPSVQCFIELHYPSSRFINMIVFETWYKKRNI